MTLRDRLNVGDEIEIEICPTEGEYAANTIDGTPFVEKFSVESLQRVVDNWKAEGSKDILCDIDHSSVETNDTIAAGWINSLFIDEDAKRLKGYLHLSQKGADLLNGLEYRYISPVLMFTEDNYPYYLDSASLTNTPRLQELKPVYNSKNFTVKNETEKPEETNVNIEEKKDSTLMEELKKLLGLPEEATEEDIKASVAELVEKVKAVAEDEAKAEAERLQEEAEEAVNACGDGVEEDKKEEVINCYKKDPALVKTILNCFKKSPAKTVVNAQEAVKPELTDAQKLKAEFDKLPGGQAKVDFMLAHRGIAL